MIIMTPHEFASMPAGTLFAPYKPCVFNDRFEIKVDAGEEVDFGSYKMWCYNGTMPIEPWLGDDAPMTFGKYDVDWEVYDGDQNDISDEKMIAVLEPEEVKRLIRILEWSLNGCKGDVPA